MARWAIDLSEFGIQYKPHLVLKWKILAEFLVEILEKANFEAVAKDLDTTNELWEATTMRIASYQQRLENLHNRRVKLHTFLPGELVLRKVFENIANPADKEFQPNWEGPYTVV